MKQHTLTDSTITHIGLDLGDRTTHLCGLNAGREVVLRTSFDTTREGVDSVCRQIPPCRIVLEAGTQSPWVSKYLQSMGHDVLVADPRRIALISKSRRKTDRRDAEVLARFLHGMPELLGCVKHRSEQGQADLAVIRARDLLVRLRTKCIQHVRSSVKVMGFRLEKMDAESFARKAPEQVPSILRPALAPILECLADLQVRIRKLERELKCIQAERYPAAEHLQSVNGVGPLTSMAFVLTLEDPSRFERSRDVGSWLGLCPRVMSSGDRDPQLPISKAGDKFMRRMAVQAAQYMLGRFGKDSDLRRFGIRLSERGGKAAKKRAVAAVARKLVVLLHHLWVSGDDYDPLYNAKREGLCT